MKKVYSILCILSIVICPLKAQWQSDLVKISGNGELTYNQDAYGFVIPDFSNAGYKNGEDIPSINLPDRTVTVSLLTDTAADHTAVIQAAIDSVSKMSLNSDGFRGIVYINPGKYYIDGSLKVEASGVIVRGTYKGDNPATSTILYARNASGVAKNIIVLGRNAHHWGSSSPETNQLNKKLITTNKIMPGDYSFDVENVTGYKVGDLICIKYPTTNALLEVLKYGGNTTSGSSWDSTLIDISYHRYIKKIEGTKITVDAPIFYTLDKSLSQAYIYTFVTTNSYNAISYNVGLENMRIEFSRTASSDTTTPDQNCVFMRSLENSWVKDVNMGGFVHAGIKTQSVTRSTIENCSAFSPSGSRIGGNQYNYENYHRSQLILYKNCRAKGGRHHYIANGGGNVSGIVVKDMTSVYVSGEISESHRLWAQGILFDNVKCVNETTGADPNDVNGEYKMGMYLRQNLGSGHGWGGTNSVFWNCSVGNGGIYLDKVPTGQNYAIGCTAQNIKRYVYASGIDGLSVGYVEGQNVSGLEPASLYDAQMAYRKMQSGASIVSTEKGISQSTAKITVDAGSISLSAIESGVFTIYRLNGTILKSIQMQSNSVASIDVPHHSFYIVRFRNDSVSIVQKLYVD